MSPIGYFHVDVSVSCASSSHNGILNEGAQEPRRTRSLNRANRAQLWMISFKKTIWEDRMIAEKRKVLLRNRRHGPQASQKEARKDELLEGAQKLQNVTV